MLAQFQQFELNFEVLKMPSDNFCTFQTPKVIIGSKSPKKSANSIAETHFLFSKKTKKGSMLLNLSEKDLLVNSLN